MGKDIQQDKLASQKVKERFDKTLGKHIEQLIGTRYGVGGLPLNLATISCLIPLVKREKEIETFPSDNPERYTRVTLLSVLDEMGLHPDEGLETALRDMIQKGYIDIDRDGKFFSNKPAMSMIQLLDRAFPRMAGMNLIAYFVQTIDEVQSERKDLKSALSQFDQTLRIQGVSLRNRKAHTQSARTPRKPAKHEIKPRKTGKPAIPRSLPRIISSKGSPGHGEIKELKFGDLSVWKPESPEISHEGNNAIEVQQSEISRPYHQDELHEKAKAGSHSLSSKADAKDLASIDSETNPVTMNPSGETVLADTTPADTTSTCAGPLFPWKSEDNEISGSKKSETRGSEIELIEADEPFTSGGITHEIDAILKEPMPEPNDTLIEDQVAAFEQTLTTLCPICKNAQIKTEKTSTGRIYYRCSNKDCSFISWGKPHHLVCPRCNNPFLVESSGRDGNTILKCPRATCRYWQRPPGGIQGKPQEQAESAPNSPTTLKRVARRRLIRRRSTRGKKT
jgi:hypothetical protein